MSESTLKHAIEKALQGHINTINDVLIKTPDYNNFTKFYLDFMIKGNEVFPKGSDGDPMNIVRSVQILHRETDTDGKESLKSVFKAVGASISDIDEQQLNETDREMLRSIKKDVAIVLG